MQKCKKCGKELSDSAMFCDTCGEKLEQIVAVDTAPTENIPQDSQTKDKPKSKKKSTFFILPAVIFVCIALAIAAGVFYTTSVLKHDNQEQVNYMFYIKDESINYTNADEETLTAVEISNKLFNSDSIDENSLSAEAEAGGYFGDKVYLSSDGSIAFYPEKIDVSEEEFFDVKYQTFNKFSLYWKYLKGNEEELAKEPSRIDNDVIKYIVNADASCVTYTKGDDMDLYQSNLIESTKLDSDVNDFYLSSDNTTILYTKSTGDIYLKAIDAEKEKIDGDVSEINYMNDDFSLIYYTKDNTLYKKASGEERVEIASEIDDVVNICNDGTIYYTKKESKEVKALDYFEDDMKDGDSKLVKPVEPEYPDYPTADYEDYVYSWMYDDYYDYLLAERDALERSQKELEAYEVAVEQYPAKYEKYLTDSSAYNNKEERDTFRKTLEKCKLNFDVVSLYYFNGSDEELISDDYNCLLACADNPVIIFKQYNSAKSQKIKMTEIAREHQWLLTADADSVTDSMNSYIENKLSETNETYIAIGVNTKGVDVDLTYDNLLINSSGTEICYIDNIDNEKKTGELYKISIVDGAAQEAVLYDEDVSLWGNKEYLADDKLVYFKNIENGKGKGDLYLNKQSVDYDVNVYNIQYIQKNNCLMYLSDWDNENQHGTFKQFILGTEGNENQTVKIADNVYKYYYAINNDILYISDYSTRHYKGALHLFRNAVDTKLADDVVNIIKYRSIEDDFQYIDIPVEVTTESTTESDI